MVTAFGFAVAPGAGISIESTVHRVGERAFPHEDGHGVFGTPGHLQTLMPRGRVHLAVSLVFVPPGSDAALAGFDANAWELREIRLSAVEIVVQVDHHGECTLARFGEKGILG